MNAGKIRIANINKIQKIWTLKLGNKNLEEISKISQSKKEFVDYVVKNTSSSWFKRPIKEPSYFDTNSYWIKKSDLKKQKIQKLNQSLEQHKRFFNYILVSTIAAIILMIVV